MSLSGGVVAPLKLAASQGFADIVQMLIGHGADVNHAVNSRDTALCTAVQMNHENIVRLLMDLGADHDSINNGLLAAASLGRTDIAQLLLEAGADKDHKARSGETALALAIEGGHDGVKNLLIEMGAC